MKFRFLLPGVYILLVLLFFVFFLKGAGGHGWNPFEFVVYLAFPAGLLLDLLPPSRLPLDDLLSPLLFILAGLIQWALIGYLIDRVVARLRRKNLRQAASSESRS